MSCECEVKPREVLGESSLWRPLRETGHTFQFAKLYSKNKPVPLRVKIPKTLESKAVSHGLVFGGQLRLYTPVQAGLVSP